MAGSKKLRLLQVGVVHVPNKTDIPKAVIDRMKDNQRIIGERVGSIKVRNIGGN